ncbi:MAG: hypothetical protein UH071_10780 [Paludibacteraceae bacterium]|jgi:hypothetical protein|nr:hypothetical protein [Paludibacteraceae bacterium]
MNLKFIMMSSLLMGCSLFTSCAKEEAEDHKNALVDNTSIKMGSGVFSVSTNKKVNFATGNVQYQPSSNTWRFAPTQYDAKLTDNEKRSDSAYNGWIDLFGWSSKANYYGVSTSTNDADYVGVFEDWGKIFGDGWRTLTFAEWDYLLFNRTTSAGSYCFSWAEVNGMFGLILFPDNYVNPDVECTYFDTKDNYLKLDYRKLNSFDLEKWAKLESAGVVFLPASGYYGNDKYYDMGQAGDYWSSTLFEYDPKSSYALFFEEEDYFCSARCSKRFSTGGSIRLVNETK